MSVAKVSALIKQYNSFVIIMHQQPDGDTIACSLALAETLGQLGKTAICISKDPIPKPFHFLPGVKTIRVDLTGLDYDVMIVIDCGDLRRTGFPSQVMDFAKKKGRVVHIDHHQKSDLYKIANVKLFDTKASATGEILYPLFQTLEVTITPDIATCLLTSLYYDTGAFKHANTTDQVLRLAAQLLHLGARLRDITKHVELTKSVAALKLWGIALGRIKRHGGLQIVTSLITQRDLAECGALEEDVAGIVNLLNSVPGAKAAILLAETPDGFIRASLRTEDATVDVSALAQLFGGGGLRRASGFMIPGRIVLRSNNWHIQL